MTPRRTSTTALAFVGPTHAPELTEFCYVRLLNVEGGTAHVGVVGPDIDGTGQEVQLPHSTFELRKVDAEEAKLWPGSYLAHPVAFVQPHGPCVGQWTNGVVARYEVNTDGTWLSVFSDGRAIAVALTEPIRVIKADPLTYTLQIGATVSDMVLNPKELLHQQDMAVQTCRKRKEDVLALVRPTLSVPFVPDDLVTLVRPHDLSMVTVRRQHVLNCLTGSRKRNTLNLYQDPRAATLPDGDKTVIQEATDTDHLDELLSIASSYDDDEDIHIASSYDDDEDIHDVRNMSRTLGKRGRTALHESTSRHPGLHDDAEADSDEDEGRGAFRPSRTQRRVSNTVMHPRFQGKSSRYVLERMQQSGHAPFQRLPPVCRGLWEFGFLSRGLTLMHCRPADLWDQVQAQDTNMSFTDFSERNTLRPAPAAASRADVTSALRSLKIFAQEFYADEVTSLIGSAVAFVDRYKAISDSDTMGWKLIAFWITKKFGKFRSLVVARDLTSAQDVQYEFSRVDEELMELMDLRRTHRGPDPSQHRGQNSETSRRGDCQRRQLSIPAAVFAALPRQGDKKLCMKWISVTGCSGNCSGGCFDSKRAHFRPKDLPDIVKTHIMERFNGLAPDPKEE